MSSNSSRANSSDLDVSPPSSTSTSSPSFKMSALKLNWLSLNFLRWFWRWELNLSGIGSAARASILQPSGKIEWVKMNCIGSSNGSIIDHRVKGPRFESPHSVSYISSKIARQFAWRRLNVKLWVLKTWETSWDISSTNSEVSFSNEKGFWWRQALYWDKNWAC